MSSFSSALRGRYSFHLRPAFLSTVRLPPLAASRDPPLQPCEAFHGRIVGPPPGTVARHPVDLDEIESGTINGIYYVYWWKADARSRGRNDSVRNMCTSSRVHCARLIEHGIAYVVYRRAFPFTFYRVRLFQCRPRGQVTLLSGLTGRER